MPQNLQRVFEHFVDTRSYRVYINGLQHECHSDVFRWGILQIIYDLFVYISKTLRAKSIRSSLLLGKYIISPYDENQSSLILINIQT